MIRIDKASQLEAKEYVLNKTMIRPKTTIWSPVLWLVFLIFVGSGIGIVVTKIFDIYFQLTITQSIIFIVGSIVILLLLGMRRELILCIKCYQHYAPEEYRRLCLCKPTCSEYALIVLKKYNFMKAIYLIYIRLTKTCRDTYKIDYP
ncbi:MAG: membrane protein insertion efficiency factor YidD [Clostridia bacterium]|nr:membrane protein insertion efficiency factor YidD [Clostridia bacterium]